MPQNNLFLFVKEILFDFYITTGLSFISFENWGFSNLTDKSFLLSCDVNLVREQIERAYALPSAQQAFCRC